MSYEVMMSAQPQITPDADVLETPSSPIAETMSSPVESASTLRARTRLRVGALDVRVAWLPGSVE
jgi:hypothetical protein